SRSRALASRICSVASCSAAAIASSASSLTPEPSVASARDARLAFWQSSEIDSAVLAMARKVIEGADPARSGNGLPRREPGVDRVEDPDVVGAAGAGGDVVGLVLLGDALL